MHFHALPVAEILGHVSFRTASDLHLSSDTRSATSPKERRGAATSKEKFGESHKVERDWKL